MIKRDCRGHVTGAYVLGVISQPSGTKTEPNAIVKSMPANIAVPPFMKVNAGGQLIVAAARRI